MRWASKSYAYQEDTDEWELGDIIVHATYLNPVGRKRNCYTQGKYFVILQVKHVVAADLEPHKLSDQVQLPWACNQTEALKKGSTWLSDDLHMIFLDEIDRWDIFDYNENDWLSSDDYSSETSGEKSLDESTSDG